MHLSFRLLLGARLLLAALAATAPGLAAQALPQTTAERTNYAATSTNAEVGAFLDSLELAGAPIAVEEGAHLRVSGRGRVVRPLGRRLWERLGGEPRGGGCEGREQQPGPKQQSERKVHQVSPWSGIAVV